MFLSNFDFLRRNKVFESDEICFSTIQGERDRERTSSDNARREKLCKKLYLARKNQERNEGEKQEIMKFEREILDLFVQTSKTVNLWYIESVYTVRVGEHARLEALLQ